MECASLRACDTKIFRALKRMKRLCIYCGSNHGFNPAFRSAAEAMGRLCAERGIGVVYGGGGVGLMGTVADAALAAGGEVIGVIPKLLVEKEKEHRGLTRLIEVDTMHERKQTMANLSDGFLALPGGIGTLEEVIEMFTWQQLGYHLKPVAVLNVAGFFDPLLSFLQSMETNGFLLKGNIEALIIGQEPDEIIDRLDNFAPTTVSKWL
jgi:uncharacterized protein (TIGR00730 family)